jgi:hypothetical protein
LNNLGYYLLCHLLLNIANILVQFCLHHTVKLTHGCSLQLWLRKTWRFFALYQLGR